MKNKPVIICKHIHSSFSSFSSGDETVRMKTDLKTVGFLPIEGGYFSSKNFPFLDGQKMDEVYQDSKCIVIYLESDKTFYYRAQGERSIFSDNFSKTPEFKLLVQSYIDKGFTTNSIKEQEEFRQRQKVKEEKKNKKLGIVLWMDYDTYKNNIKLYQGGFSDNVFNSEPLQNYLRGGGVFGWIGNSDRTFYADKLIEKGLRKRGISPSRMSNWITSSSGRHFGDSLGGCTKEEQKEKIEKSLSYMFNCCIIYGFSSHKGMFKDTMRIDDELEKYNLLLNSKEQYDSKKYLNNLLKTKKSLLEKSELNEFEKEFVEVIDDIFHNLV